MIHPTPLHLRDTLLVDPAASDEHELNGSVRCPCGSAVHKLLYVADLCRDEAVPYLRVIEKPDGFFLRIGAQCTACAKVHLVFDDDFHGYNGYACADEDQRARPRPDYETYSCHRCKGVGHRILIGIVGDLAKEDLVEDSDTLNESNGHEAFGWLTVEVTCNGCGYGPLPLVDYETR